MSTAVLVCTETVLYQFDDLSERAKETARDWFREGMDVDTFWSEYVIDTAKEAGALMGIQVDNIYFSGFWSQGDGACFTGSYSYQVGGLAAVVKEFGGGSELHRIARDLQAIQRRAFYGLYANVSASGRYCHEHSTDISVSHDFREVTDDQEDALQEVLRDFMRWIYRSLEQEYNYTTSDEAVDESIRINEYTFNEDGERAG